MASSSTQPCTSSSLLPSSCFPSLRPPYALRFVALPFFLSHLCNLNLRGHDLRFHPWRLNVEGGYNWRMKSVKGDT
ncbi:hypothetical protein SESBI_42893 [Sesbania bispinosa]|nr:hypothetical protein SESBI_42893 [Sesbania bispinosa]